jgi:predicted RNA-binding protein YlxR (DUF448 family)
MLAMSSDSKRGRERAATDKREHSRTCVGCGKATPQSEVRRADARLPREAAATVLVRLVIGPARAIAVDAGDSRFGRGVYVHATPSCVAAAVRGLARAAKGKVDLDGAPATEASLRVAISTAYDRRVAGLLAAAKRAKKLECGSDAVTAVCRAGRGALVVIATDAAQAADLTEVRRALREGWAIPWGTKVSLAGAVLEGTLSPNDTSEGRTFGVVAVTDDRIARAVKEAWLVAAALASIPTSIPTEGAATLLPADGARSSQSSVRGSPRDPGGSSGAVE